MLLPVESLMTIGEFSKRSGLSPSRLRSYAASEVLVPSAVDASSGYRYYSIEQLRDARVIDALRDVGMPVSEIASFLRDPSAAALDTWARQLEVDVAQRREALLVARELVSTKHPEQQGTQTMTTLQAATRTDIGRTRETNEDAAMHHDRLVAVADGMGGAPGGEIAAAAAVALIESAFTGRSIDELEAATRAANRTIWDHANASQDLEGMGTTICAAGVTDDSQLVVVHVGDSRAYLLRDGVLQQLTQDHSLTAELVRRGELTESEAAVHPQRNIITRALGMGPTVDVDAATHAIKAGDRVLLCTDGLFNELPDEELASMLGTAPDVHAAADTLVERAVENGGRDNITVVVADVRG
jgi:serine/threonine protein phosphatase PrpC